MIRKMQNLVARIFAGGSVLMGVATADAIQGQHLESPMEWLAVAGVFAGTFYRARLWFDKEKGPNWLCIRDDIMAISALCFISLGLCELFEVTRFSAGLVGTGCALVGVEFLTILGKGAAENAARFLFGTKKDGGA